MLPLLNRFARVPLCGLISFYDGSGQQAADRLPATMRTILTRSLTVRGFINDEFAETHHPAFLRDVSTAIRDGRVRSART